MSLGGLLLDGVSRRERERERERERDHFLLRMSMVILYTSGLLTLLRSRKILSSTSQWLFGDPSTTPLSPSRAMGKVAFIMCSNGRFPMGG